jgi:hypothetical protein
VSMPEAQGVMDKFYAFFSPAIEMTALFLLSQWIYPRETRLRHIAIGMTCILSRCAAASRSESMGYSAQRPMPAYATRRGNYSSASKAFSDWPPGRPELLACERGHVEGLLVGRIAVFRSVGTGVAVEAAAVAARRAVAAADMRQAGFVGEYGFGMSADRTGFQARFSDTCVAEMNRLLRR